MERRLPCPLDAEISDATGEPACVRLVTYLGESRWRGQDADGQTIIVEAEQILTLSQVRPQAAG